MDISLALLQKLKNWSDTTLSISTDTMTISGAGPAEWSFLYYLSLVHDAHGIQKSDCKTSVFICPNAEIAESLFEKFRSREFFTAYFFPGLEFSPYREAMSLEHNLYSRFFVLDQLLSHKSSKHLRPSRPPKPQVIFCSAEAFMQRIPPPDFFKENSFLLSTSDILAPYDLAQKLVQHGYTSSITTEEPGTFAKKGEIFDIFPTSGFPIRIHYFDDMIEEIYLIDVETQKTLRNNPLDSARIPPAPHIFTGGNFSNHLRSKIPMPPPQFKNKYEARKDLFGHLSDGNLFSYTFPL